MVDESRRVEAATVLRRINQAWLSGRIDDLVPLVHPGIVTVVPGFAAGIQGRDAFLAGFRDFCQSATIHEFREHDYRVDVVGDTAVATFRYEMLYERSGERYRCTGRDLWVFQRQDGGWIAVWRTMLDMEENPA
jgi:ketosteroid isomerase-like protein